MTRKPPKPGQAVYVFDQRGRRPDRLVYVKRNRSWYYFERYGVPIKFNGCPDWHEHASQACWAAFASHVVSAGTLCRAGAGREWAVDRAFSLACEYVRQFADEIKQSPAQVWDAGRSAKPEEGAP